MMPFSKADLPPKILISTLIVTIGGFLFGFDASVISGTIGFIRPKFGLNEFEVGWLVSSPSLSAMFAMLFIGRISDHFGRKKVLILIALLYFGSSLLSALAPNFAFLVGARMLGGVAFGSALVIAPLYITEISPSAHRGRLVSYQQLNIVIGFSASYFSNYFILKLSAAEWWALDEFWRLMLGIEMIPALFFFMLLFSIPESPRWYQMKGYTTKLSSTLRLLYHQNNNPDSELDTQLLSEYDGQIEDDKKIKAWVKTKILLSNRYRFIFFIALVLGIVQQITGINVIFFYAPIIFEKTGLSQNASFAQAAIVGCINLLFTLIAILFIDKIGRKPLVLTGLIGMLLSLLLISNGFQRATYQVNQEVVEQIDLPDPTLLAPIFELEFNSEQEFRSTVYSLLSKDERYEYEAQLFSKAIQIDVALVLTGILGFVASFAFSLGPVMWVMISELFPNHLRGIALSIIGFVNSFTSWMVQFLFPVQIQYIGSAETYGLYAIFALMGLLFLWHFLPETKGKSLSELQRILIPSVHRDEMLR